MPITKVAKCKTTLSCTYQHIVNALILRLDHRKNSTLRITKNTKSANVWYCSRRYTYLGSQLFSLIKGRITVVNCKVNHPMRWDIIRPFATHFQHSSNWLTVYQNKVYSMLSIGFTSLFQPSKAQ